MTPPALIERPSDNTLINSAVHAYRKGEYRSLAAAARAHDVNSKTVTARSHGRPSLTTVRQARQKLTVIEEDVICDWVIRLYSQGFPASKATISGLANVLLARRDWLAQEKPETVGKNWVDSWLKRHPNFEKMWAKRKEDKRVQAERPVIINHWFSLISQIVEKHKIKAENAWNMDETGVMIGMGQRVRVVVPKNGKKRHVTESGNRESTSVIECISAAGVTLPPTVIFAGKTHQDRQYPINLPERWRWGRTDKGYTSDEMAVDWLKETFEPLTKTLNGETRLLIMDGQSTHTSVNFISLVMELGIILVYLPPHATHLLQPLDVGCFAPLKQRYEQIMAETFKWELSNISKAQFVEIYEKAREQAFTGSIVSCAWRSAGLFPISRNKILSQLDLVQPLIRPRPRTPPYTVNDFNSYLPSPQQAIKTPQNEWEVEEEWDKVIKHPVFESLMSSPTFNRLSQLKKSAVTTMAEKSLALEENKFLREANRAKAERTRLGSHHLSKARVCGSEDLRIAREQLERRGIRSRVTRQRLTVNQQIHLPQANTPMVNSHLPTDAALAVGQQEIDQEDDNLYRWVDDLLEEDFVELMDEEI